MEKICGVISVSFKWWSGNGTGIPADPGTRSGIDLCHQRSIVLYSRIGDAVSAKNAVKCMHTCSRVIGRVRKIANRDISFVMSVCPHEIQ